MCIIIAADRNKPFNLEHLQECAEGNPHGGGIAWVGDKGRVNIFRDMDDSKVIAKCLEVPADVPRIAHFRIASVGAVAPELLHPWPCTRSANSLPVTDCAMALAHNGTWGAWRDIALKAVLKRQGTEVPAGDWNDSRAMAWLSAILGPNWLSFLPTDQKVATLTHAGIRLYGHFHEDKETGLFYSNRGFEPYAIYQTWSYSKPAPVDGIPVTDAEQNCWIKDRSPMKRDEVIRAFRASNPPSVKAESNGAVKSVVVQPAKTPKANRNNRAVRDRLHVLDDPYMSDSEIESYMRQNYPGSLEEVGP